MGKRLIIKGADFSANAITTNQSEVIAVLATGFTAQKGLNENGGAVTNLSKCCVSMADISPLLSEGSKLSIRVKNNFDFVFGIGNGSTITWYQAGDSVVGTFEWITISQTAIAPISSTQKYIFLNFRYKDQTTNFSSETTLDDLLDVAIIV